MLSHHIHRGHSYLPATFNLLLLGLMVASACAEQVVSQKQEGSPVAAKQPIAAEDVQRIINQVRTDPKSLIPHIKEIIGKFEGDREIKLSPTFYHSTNEGIGAWQEAVGFLEKQKPLPPFDLHSGLSKAATEHVVDLATHNLMGHVGSNGSTLTDRIRRYCVYNRGSVGENVAQEFPYTGRDHALETVTGLIVDDGVPDRGHRSSIFSSMFRYAGIASRRSGRYIITVIDYASQNLQEIAGAEPPSNIPDGRQDEPYPGSDMLNPSIIVASGPHDFMNFPIFRFGSFDFYGSSAACSQLKFEGSSIEFEQLL